MRVVYLERAWKFLEHDLHPQFVPSFSIWLFLSCILYGKPEIVSKVLS